MPRRLVALAAFLFSCAATAAIFTQPDLLDPDKAFQISARALDDRNVEVRFRTADGYYMYRHAFTFETVRGRPMSKVELPSDIRKKDPFFGEAETYPRDVAIRVPVMLAGVSGSGVRLKVSSQGCADVGVCYVPHEQVVQVRLPASKRLR